MSQRNKFLRYEAEKAKLQEMSAQLKWTQREYDDAIQKLIKRLKL